MGRVTAEGERRHLELRFLRDCHSMQSSMLDAGAQPFIPAGGTPVIQKDWPIEKTKEFIDKYGHNEFLEQVKQRTPSSRTTMIQQSLGDTDPQPRGPAAATRYGQVAPCLGNVAAAQPAPVPPPPRHAGSSQDPHAKYFQHIRETHQQAELRLLREQVERGHEQQKKEADFQAYADRERAELENRLRHERVSHCLLYTSPSPRDGLLSRMPSSA